MTLTASYHGVFEWHFSGLNLEMKCNVCSQPRVKKAEEKDVGLRPGGSLRSPIIPGAPRVREALTKKKKSKY